jgi:TPR repeat protein
LAELHLGQYYYGNGGVVAEDSKKAFEWVLKAARQNNSEAQIKMGEYFLNGYGCDKSDTKMIEWITKAANAGNGQAQTQLGYFYKY